ncbi:Gfo/Idh/MocA family oxidoreductase [Armatimonas sp.]|uniref:Gfo/Idh/MocA family protein n=1 Tax=Armatimonas sp. TaxID=1872638 RepID=UPI00286CFB13|nr:Gfo/Idh/MocA family oxidoreductase [Armatimonas sp.]
MRLSNRGGMDSMKRVDSFATIFPQNPKGANEKIVYGHIGVGGMGSSHIVPDSCAAICDVDANHLKNAAAKVKGSPFLTDDYRRLLERKDIDAVTIGTPDHWHALMTVHACQAGKDVYSEKPTCKTIEEGRAMIEAARRYKRVVQIGSQGRSNPGAAMAYDYIRNGQLGTVKDVTVWHPNNFVEKNSFGKEGPPPPELNWEMWLGPIAWRPYNPDIVHFNFRWLMDSGGGFIRDRGNHVLSVVMWCLNQDAWDSPVTVEAMGKTNPNSVYDAPLTMQVKWEFSNPKWTMTWDQPGVAPERFEGPWGALYKGDKDDLIVLGGDGGCTTEEKARFYKPPAGGIKAFMEPEDTDPTERHRRNWRRCIRTREKPVMDVEIGVKVIVLPIIANIAYVLGRKLTYDPKKWKFIGDDEANKLLYEPYRAPWSLKGV